MTLNKSIALISIYPPPFGGISVHAKVLAEELADRNMINILITGGKRGPGDPAYLKRVSSIQIFNIIIHWHYKIPLILRLYSRKIKLIHCHAGLTAVAFFLLHRFVFKKSIIHTIHNQWVKERYDKLNFFSKLITKIFLRDKKTFWICVNENAFNQMLDLGVKIENITVIPAYISHKQKVTSTGDLDTINKIETFKKDSKLIGVYGFKFYLDSNNNDVYGFNFSIDVLKQLIKTIPFVKLVILIPSASPSEEKKKILSRIKNEGLESYVLTIFDQPIINMALFWNQLDIYFRPTTDDGDSLAIREALANGITVIASDASNRPKETIVFKSLDLGDAVKNLSNALNSKEIVEVNTENYLEKLLKFYEDKCEPALIKVV